MDAEAENRKESLPQRIDVPVFRRPPALRFANAACRTEDEYGGGKTQ